MPIYKMKGSKDGKQKYRVVINFQDNLGRNKQIQRVTYGSGEGKAFEIQLNMEIKEKPPTSRMTVQMLYDEYSKAVKNELRESTFHKNTTTLENHVLPHLKDTPLDKLTAPVIQNWKNTIDESDLSIRTKKNIFSCFRALLNWGIKLDYLQTNILLKVGNFKSSELISHNIDYYTAEEFKKFIKAAREYAEKSANLIEYDFYVFFCIAFYCGLRKGEIHALKWSDIDGSYLSVRRSITQKLKGGDRETPPKNKSSIRTLQLPKPLMDILDEHKKRWQQTEGFTDDYRICGGTKPLRDSSVENHNERYAKAAGIKKIRIHDFRHSHVSLLANEGINIQEIARRLGHANIEMTWNTYSHLYPREEERAIEILNKIV